MELADLIVVVVMVAFVALCAAYVRWCERLVGPDPAVVGGGERSDGESVAAGTVR